MNNSQQASGFQRVTLRVIVMLGLVVPDRSSVSLRVEEIDGETRKLKKTITSRLPEWRKAFVFDVLNVDSTAITLIVKRKSFFKGKPVGCFQIPLRDLLKPDEDRANIYVDFPWLRMHVDITVDDVIAPEEYQPPRSAPAKRMGFFNDDVRFKDQLQPKGWKTNIFKRLSKIV